MEQKSDKSTVTYIVTCIVTRGNSWQRVVKYTPDSKNLKLTTLNESKVPIVALCLMSIVY